MAREDKRNKLISKEEYLYLLSKILLKCCWVEEVYSKNREIPLSYSTLSSLNPSYALLNEIRKRPGEYLDEIPHLEGLLEEIFEKGFSSSIREKI
jgi:hypothetical protein